MDDRSDPPTETTAHELDADRLLSQLNGCTGTPQYSRNDATEMVGIDPERSDRVWSAFGFSNNDPDAKVLTEDDVQALALMSMIDNAQPERMALEVAMARSIGQTMSRLADWEASQFAEVLSDPTMDVSMSQVVTAIERIHSLIWRRHFAAAITSLAATADPDHRPQSIGFADLVGYTSLSRRVGLTELSDLLETFETHAHRAIIDAGGAVVKTIGDEVMYSADTADTAAEIAMRLQQLPDHHDLPQLRGGVATGKVLWRFGDVFGEPVNIAARLTGSARPGTVLVDKNCADAITDPRFRLRFIPPLNVRGYRRLSARVLSYARVTADQGSEK